MLTIAETILAVCLLCLAGLCGYALGKLEKIYREDDNDG
jgi:hypothetical protein